MDAREDLQRRVGAYVLGPAIGRGASATLYRAHHPILGRWAALKLAHDRVGWASSAGQPAANDLMGEGRVLARLRHPGVVTLYDAGRHEGRPYLALELLTGPSLAQLAHPATIANILAIGRRLAGALAYLHEEGIVHADLKPSNILLRRPGQPVLVDFGLAHRHGPGHLPAGTPAYMAPEQAEGHAGPRSDLYALGLVLYRLATGVLPLPPGSPLEMVRGHRRWVAREVEALRPDTPPRLALAIHRCLAKEADDRFQSARELEEELARAGVEQGRSARAIPSLPPPVRPGHRPVRWLLAPLLLGLATAPLWSLWHLLLAGP